MFLWQVLDFEGIDFSKEVIDFNKEVIDFNRKGDDFEYNDHFQKSNFQEISYLLEIWLLVFNF